MSQILIQDVSGRYELFKKYHIYNQGDYSEAKAEYFIPYFTNACEYEKGVKYIAKIKESFHGTVKDVFKYIEKFNKNSIEYKKYSEGLKTMDDKGSVCIYFLEEPMEITASVNVEWLPNQIAPNTCYEFSEFFINSFCK